MASITQGALNVVMFQTLYWQSAPVTFLGFITGTQCSVIQRFGYKECDVVTTSSLTTTATG